MIPNAKRGYDKDETELEKCGRCIQCMGLATILKPLPSLFEFFVDWILKYFLKGYVLGCLRQKIKLFNYNLGFVRSRTLQSYSILHNKYQK